MRRVRNFLYRLPSALCFCQNHEISQEGFGLKITVERLAEIMLELQAELRSISTLWHSPTTDHISIEAVRMARKAGLTLPIVCNTSGYETVEVVRAMGELLISGLPTFQYASLAVLSKCKLS